MSSTIRGIMIMLWVVLDFVTREWLRFVASPSKSPLQKSACADSGSSSLRGSRTPSSPRSPDKITAPSLSMISMTTSADDPASIVFTAVCITGSVVNRLVRDAAYLGSVVSYGHVLVMILAAAFHISPGELGARLINAALGSLAAFVGGGRLRRAPIQPFNPADSVRIGSRIFGKPEVIVDVWSTTRAPCFCVLRRGKGLPPLSPHTGYTIRMPPIRIRLGDCVRAE